MNLFFFLKNWESQKVEKLKIEPLRNILKNWKLEIEKVVFLSENNSAKKPSTSFVDCVKEIHCSETRRKNVKWQRGWGQPAKKKEKEKRKNKQKWKKYYFQWLPLIYIDFLWVFMIFKDFQRHATQVGLANENVGAIRKSIPACRKKMPFHRETSLTLNDNVAVASRAKERKEKDNEKTEMKNDKFNDCHWFILVSNDFQCFFTGFQRHATQVGLANEKVGGVPKSIPACLKKMPYFRGTSLTLSDNVAGASQAKRKKRKRGRNN